MDHQLYDIIAQYGIYAVFALCTVEGDITLLLSGTMAHGGLFGKWGFLKVLIAGTLGGVVGDSVGYAIGRIFHENAKDYRFYQVAQPRVEKLMAKFGGSAIIISKYIYGIRMAVCLSYGVSRMPFPRFVTLSAISCFLWVLLLSGVGYFFSGAITSIIGDFKQVGFALFFVVMFGIIMFYVIERYWLSERVEDADPETIHKIEEKLLAVEEVGKTTLHDLTERLHLTREPHRDDRSDPADSRAATAAKPFSESDKKSIDL
jgi:membrane protein DedA with SNARE-associated domain